MMIHGMQVQWTVVLSIHECKGKSQKDPCKLSSQHLDTILVASNLHTGVESKDMSGPVRYLHLDSRSFIFRKE